MHNYSLTHVSDAILLRDLTALAARDRITTAALLAHIAEVDARRLYAPAGHPSMYAYCVDDLRLSEDAASKRIQAARAAREFPGLLTALSEGRLHLSAVCLLAPHLTVENSEELIDAAAHRRKSEIEELLTRRFGRLGATTRVRVLTPIATGSIEHAPGHIGLDVLTGVGGEIESEQTGDGDDQHAPGHVDHTNSTETAPDRFLLQTTITQRTHEKLRYAQALLSHAVPTGDVAQVLDRALDALIGELEKRKLGGTIARRRRERTSLGKRHVPAHVRRAVWERDQGQCTFTSAGGKRCMARRFLEFDHIEPVARGGKATVDGLRLRCRAHNQYEAERMFGAGFMSRKREEARLKAASRAQAAAEVRAQSAVEEQARDVMAGLRNLGCRPHEVRRTAEFSQTLPSATLEERMRAALRFLGGRSVPGRGSNGGGSRRLDRSGAVADSSRMERPTPSAG